MNLVEKGLVDTVGEDEGGMNWESTIDIYTLSCVKIDSGKLQNNIESPALCSVMTERGGFWGVKGSSGGEGYI